MSQSFCAGDLRPGQAFFQTNPTNILIILKVVREEKRIAVWWLVSAEPSIRIRHRVCRVDNPITARHLPELSPPLATTRSLEHSARRQLLRRSSSLQQPPRSW